jgi:hypothetical protein
MAIETVDRETGEVVEVEEREGFPDARLNPRFIQMRQGRPFVAYPGLLDLLHQLSEGFFAVETEVVQLPGADNGHTAVCIARVRIFDPESADVVRRETTGIGDADPSNVSAQMRPHLLRMAETRAKARALRDAVNVGMAALEELGPDEPEKGPVRDRPVDRIEVGGQLFSRAEVVSTKRGRVEACQDAGIALPVPVPPDEAPLSDQVAFSQRLRELLLRRRSEAKAQASPGEVPAK